MAINTDTEKMFRILGEEVKDIFVTGKELGESIKTGSEILRKALNELQIEVG